MAAGADDYGRLDQVEIAGARHRALGRREEPDPGVARPADEEGPRRHEDTDCKRHGTTTLFAALNVLDGTVIGRNMQRHRHQEFIRFLTAIEAAVPTGSQVHALVDRCAAHKHPQVRAWLDRHPRWTFPFAPTS